MIRVILILLVIVGLTATVFWKSSLQKPDNLEERVKALEDAVVSIRAELKSMPSSSPDTQNTNININERIAALEKAMQEAKNQQIVSKSPSLYIPLGSGGTAGDKAWSSVPGYEVSLDPADYPGYSGMQLEVNFRMLEIAGVGMARLYNQTDNQAASGELSIAADNFSLQTTPSFKLPSGKKTYRLQIKSTYGANLEIQNARIKVYY